VLGLNNVAYGAAASASSVVTAATITAPLSVNGSAELGARYASLCAAASQVYSSVPGDAAPSYQVDLGTLALVTDVQLWTAAAFSAWLSPVSVYVSPGPSLAGAPACFSYASNASVVSVQQRCASPILGRYVTLVLTGDNSGQPGSRMLKLCSLMAFGAFLAPPPPRSPSPPPLPLPSSPPPWPPSPALVPYNSSRWKIIVAVVVTVFGAVMACFLCYFLCSRARRRQHKELQRGFKARLDGDIANWYGRNNLAVPTMAWPAAQRGAGAPPGNPGALVGITLASSPRYVSGFTPSHEGELPSPSVGSPSK
jgi:hypothetical protein